MPVNESYDKEINKRTKELSKRPVSNKRGEVLQQQQEVQNQLQVLQNERRNNLLSQKTESNAQDQTNQLLNQAAELGVGGATAATLKKYGIQGGPTVNRQHTQSREVRTTPSKITIINNNNTTNTTNTKVDGGVGGNNSDSSGKFKSWLTKVNAQQQEASARRDRDYARRESDLTRSANKMLRKVESIGKGIVETFNPQQFGQSVGGQLKMFLLIFGMRFLAKYWDQVIEGVKWIGDAVENVGGFFGIGKKGKEFAARGSGFLPTLVKLFGGDPKKENVAQAIGNSVSSALDHFGLKLEHMMEIRGAAIGKVKFQMPKSKGAIGGVLKATGIDTFFADTFSAVTKYLGDIFTALVNPEKGLKNTINSEMNKVADSNIKAAQARDSGKSRTATIAPGISQGDYAAFNTKGGRRYSLLEGSVNAGGQLTGNKAGQVSQSMDILGVYRDARMTGKVDTARLLTGLQRLQDGARRGGTVAVDPEFIAAMFDQATLRNLIGSRHITPRQYKFVADKKSAYERGQEIGNPAIDGMGIGYDVGKGVGKVLGLGIPVISDITGFGVGVVGGAIGGAVGQGVYYAKDAMTNDYTLRLVPINDPRPAVQNKTAQVFEIDETAVRAIAQKYGAKGFDYADERLVKALQSSIYQKAGGYSAVRGRWHGRGSNETYNIRRGYSRVDEFNRMRQRHRVEEENDEFNRRHQRAMGTIKGIGNSVIDAGMGVYNGAMGLIEPGKGKMRTGYNPSTGQYYGTGYDLPGGSSSSGSPTYYTPQPSSSSSQANYSRATYTTVTYQSTSGNGGDQRIAGARTWGNPLTPTSTELSFNVEVAAQECLRLSTLAIYGRRGENPQPWRKKPGTQSTGGSSGHVRRAIAKGLGLNTLSNYPRKAKDYINFLYLYGFAPVPWNSYVPRKGDVNICGPTPNHKFGHICLNCGNAWVSDYVQRDMWGDAEFRNNKYATVLRHIRCTGSLGDNSIGPDIAESGNSSGYIDFNGDGKYDAFQDSDGKVYELDSSGNLGKELDVNTVNSQVNSSSTFTSTNTNTNYQSTYSSNYASYSSNPPSPSYNSSSYYSSTPTYNTPTYSSTPTTPTVRSSGGGVSSKSDFSGLVTNPLMKKVLSDCGHLDSNTLGKGYTLTRTYHHCCTSGPTTWYRKAGIQLRWWRSPKTATVEEMRRNLQASGMVPVWHGTGQEANAKLNSSQYLRPGDIASMLSSNSSHGVMWTGEDWRSDALQGSKPYPYSSRGRGGDWTFILWRHPALQESNTGVMGEGFSGGDNYYIGGGGSSYSGGGSMGTPSYSSSGSYGGSYGGGSYGGGSYYSGGMSSGPVAYTGAGMGTSNYVPAGGGSFISGGGIPSSVGGGINLNDPIVQAAINHTGGYSKGQKAEYIRDAYLAFRAAGMSHIVAVASIAQDIQEAGFGSSAVARLGNNYSGISAMPKRGILPYRPGGRWGGFQNLGHYAREKKALLDRLYPGATTAQSPEEYMRAVQGVDASGHPIKGRYAWCATETYGGVSSDRFKYIDHVLGNVNTVNSLISANADLSRLLNSGGQLPQGMPMLGGGGINWRSERPQETKIGTSADRNYTNQNAMAMINFLRSKGLPAHAAIGVAGSIMGETAYNPYHSGWDVNGPSGGIAAWHDKAGTEGNFARLKKFAASRGKPWTDIGTQAEFLWYSLTEGSYKNRNIIEKLKNAKSIEEASYIWGHDYEVFKGYNDWNSKSHQRRMQYGRDLAQLYKQNGEYGYNSAPQGGVPGGVMIVPGGAGAGLKPGFNLGYGNVLMVGDSWGVGMKKYFTQNTAVGSTGLFSRNGRPDLPSVTDQINAANYSNGVIIVHSGGNDIALRAKSGGQAAVREDVQRAVAAAAAKGNKVIFVAAPWMNHSSKSVTGNRDKYNEWLRDAVLSSGAGFIDTNPIMDYMKQHQPRYGQFHLNDYSGYAQFILQEAQKQVNGTGAQVGIPQMQQMQQSPMPVQPMQVQQVVPNATRNLKAERLALDKEMKELEKAKRELEKEKKELDKDKLEKDIKKLEAERDRLEKEAEKLEKRLKEKGIEEKEKEEIKDKIEEIDTKEDKLDEELKKLEEQKKKAEEGSYEKRKKELEEKEKDLKRRKEDLDKAEKTEEKQQLEKVMEKSEYTFFGHMTNLEKKVSAMGSKSFAMSVWSLHPSLQAKWNAIGGFDVWYKNEFSKLSPKKQAQYAVELESEDVMQATSSKDMLFHELRYYDPETNTYKTTDILQDFGVTNGLRDLLNSDYKRDENGNIIVDSSGNPMKQGIYVPDASTQPEEFQKFFKAYYTSLSPEKRELLSSLLMEEKIRHDFSNEMYNDQMIAYNINNHDFLDRNYGAHDDETKEKVEKELREKYGLTMKDEDDNYISPFALLGYQEGKSGYSSYKKVIRKEIGDDIAEQLALANLVREGNIAEFTKKIEESAAYKDFYTDTSGYTENSNASNSSIKVNPLAVNLAERANDNDIYFDLEANKYYTKEIDKNGKEVKKYVEAGDFYSKGNEVMTKRDFSKKLLLASLFASDEFEKYQEQIDKLMPSLDKTGSLLDNTKLEALVKYGAAEDWDAAYSARYNELFGRNVGSYSYAPFTKMKTVLDFDSFEDYKKYRGGYDEKHKEDLDFLTEKYQALSDSYNDFAKSTSAAYEIAKLQNIQANLTTGFESINDTDDIRTKLQKEERNRSRAKWNAIIAKKQSEYNNWEMDTWSLLQQDAEAKQKFTNKYGVGEAAMQIYLNSKEGKEARDAAFNDMILAMREKQLMESGGDKPFADEFVQFAKALHYKDFKYLTEGGLSEKADLAKSISLTRDEKRAELEKTHKYLDQKAFADLMAQQGNKEYKEADEVKKKMMQDDYNTKIAREIEEELHKQTQEHVQTIINAAANKKFNEAEATAALEHIGLGGLVTKDQIKGAKSGEQIFKEVKDEEGNWHYYGMDGKEILVEDRDANGKKIKRTLKTEERDKYYSGLDKAGVTGYRYANVKDRLSGKEEQLKIVGRTKDGEDVVQSPDGQLSILKKDKEGKLYASGVSKNELYKQMGGVERTLFGKEVPIEQRDAWLKQQFEEEGKRSYAYRQLQDWRDQVLDKNGPGYGIAGYNLKDEVKWTDKEGQEHKGNVRIGIHEESLEDYKKRDAVVRGDMTAEEAMLDNISTMLGRRLSEEEKGAFLEQARANDGKVSFADITIPGTNGKKAFAIKKGNGDMQIIPDNSVLFDLYKGDEKLARQQGFDTVTARQYAEQQHLERVELSKVQSKIAGKQLTVEGANFEALQSLKTEVSAIARKMDAIQPGSFNNYILANSMEGDGFIGKLKSVTTAIRDAITSK